MSAAQTRSDASKLAGLKAFKGLKPDVASTTTEEKSGEEKADAPPPTRMGFLSKFKSSVKKVIVEDTGKSSISNLVPPFLGFVRKNEKKYASEIGQLNIMLREARGLFEGVEDLVDQLNESLAGSKNVDIYVASDKIKSIKTLIGNSDWLFDMTLASSKLEEHYGNTNNPAKAVANNLMAASYSQISVEAKNNNEDEKVVNIVNNLTENLHYQTKLIGGWKNVLYRMDGTIDQDIVLDDWTDHDKIEILKEINNFNKREIEKLKREKVEELQQHNKQLEEARAKHPYSDRRVRTGSKDMSLPGINTADLDLAGLGMEEVIENIKLRYSGEISTLTEKYNRLESCVRDTVETLRPLYYDSVRGKSLISNEAIGSRDKDKNRSASVQLRNMISENAYTSNPGINTIYPSMTDEMPDNTAVLDGDGYQISAEGLFNSDSLKLIDSTKSLTTPVKGLSRSIMNNNEENIVLTKSIRLQPNPHSKVPPSPSQTASPGLYSSTSEDSMSFLVSPLPVTSAAGTRPMSRSSLVNHQSRKHAWKKAEEERRRLKGLDVLQRNSNAPLNGGIDTFPIISTPTKTQRNKSVSYCDNGPIPSNDRKSSNAIIVDQPANFGTPSAQMTAQIVSETDVLIMGLNEVCQGITTRILFGLQNVDTSKLGIISDTSPSDIMRRAQIINRQLVGHMNDIKILEDELKKLSFNFNGEGTVLGNANKVSNNARDLHSRSNSVSLGTMLRSASKANLAM